MGGEAITQRKKFPMLLPTYAAWRGTVRRRMPDGRHVWTPTPRSRRVRSCDGPFFVAARAKRVGRANASVPAYRRPGGRRYEDTHPSTRPPAAFILPLRSGARRARRSGECQHTSLPTALAAAATKTAGLPPPQHEVFILPLRSGARRARRSGECQRAGLPTARPVAMTPPLRRHPPFHPAARGVHAPIFVAARAERVGRVNASLPTAWRPPLRRLLAFHLIDASRPCPLLRSGARRARRSDERRVSGELAIGAGEVE